MTTIELCRKVKSEHQAHLFRPRLDQPGQYDVREWGIGGRKRGWTLMDATTASAILAVYDALKEENKRKMETLHPVVAARVAWKLVRPA